MTDADALPPTDRPDDATPPPDPFAGARDTGFDTDQPEIIAPGEGELILDLEGYEGPLDMLLTLAREQKVDLRRISMVALVDQYLAFIASARRLRLEIAADYLVMAAWLTYLKSRLLLPEPPKDEEPTGEQMAEALQRQLRLLEAMQEAGVRLMARPRLGIDTFGRGQPEGVLVVRKSRWQVQLYDLLKVYGEIHRPRDADAYHIAPTEFFSPEEAVERLSRMLGIAIDWASIAAFLPPGLTDPMKLRSAVAATFVASLHLAKEGVVQLRQTESFGPIFLRKRTDAPSAADDDHSPAPAA
jgi:segregation and condensation protein A